MSRESMEYDVVFVGRGPARIYNTIKLRQLWGLCRRLPNTQISKYSNDWIG